MLVYQIRRRVLMTEGAATLAFPNDVVVEMHFTPKAPFGGSTEASRTMWAGGRTGHAVVDPMSGRLTVQPETNFGEAAVVLPHPDFEARFDGNILRIDGHAESAAQLNETIEQVHFLLPVVMSLDFIDVPTVQRVIGTVGGVPFVWRLARSSQMIETTSKERQEDRLRESWQRFLNAFPKERRVLVALNYFFVACRLERAGYSPWEFMSEVLLNLCKVLETLFPPNGTTGSIDAARAGLGNLGIDEDTVERDFVPVIALRNSLDVGHPSLAYFKRKDLETVHAYCESVETSFRKMLTIVTDRLCAGTLELVPYEPSEAGSETVGIIERIAARLATDPPAENAER